MDISTDKSYQDSLIEIMGSKKKQCLDALFITEQDLYEMDFEEFQCAQANVLEWLNDFYMIRK